MSARDDGPPEINPTPEEERELSRARWDAPTLGILRRQWPAFTSELASEPEDYFEVTDYHVQFHPALQRWRAQWRALRWQGFRTFTRKDARADGAPTEATKLAAGAEVHLWIQGYFLRDDCVALAIARAPSLLRLWPRLGRRKWNPRPGASGGWFSAVDFGQVPTRWEWGPSTGWKRFVAGHRVPPTEREAHQ